MAEKTGKFRECVAFGKRVRELREEKSLTQFQFASQNGAISVLAEYDSGAASILVAREDGLLVVRVPEDGPESWKTSAADWLPQAK